MSMSNPSSDIVRDVMDPGWRDRELRRQRTIDDLLSDVPEREQPAAHEDWDEQRRRDQIRRVRPL